MPNAAGRGTPSLIFGPAVLGRASGTAAPAQPSTNKGSLATADSPSILGTLPHSPAQPVALLPLEPSPTQPRPVGLGGFAQDAAIDALSAALPDPVQAGRDSSHIAAQQAIPQSAKQRRAAKPTVLKADPKPSPAAALQQYRRSMESVSAASLSLSNLPQAYAARCLTGPGSEFIPSFQAGFAALTCCIRYCGGALTFL